jgi:hypothetical protein
MWIFTECNTSLLLFALLLLASTVLQTENLNVRRRQMLILTVICSNINNWLAIKSIILLIPAMDYVAQHDNFQIFCAGIVLSVYAGFTLYVSSIIDPTIVLWDHFSSIDSSVKWFTVVAVMALDYYY